MKSCEPRRSRDHVRDGTGVAIPPTLRELHVPFDSKVATLPYGSPRPDRVWTALTDTLLGGLLVKKSVLRRDRTLFRFSVKWKNRVRPLASNVRMDFRFSCMGEGV